MVDDESLSNNNSLTILRVTFFYVFSDQSLKHPYSREDKTANYIKRKKKKRHFERRSPAKQTFFFFSLYQRSETFFLFSPSFSGFTFSFFIFHLLRVTFSLIQHKRYRRVAPNVSRENHTGKMKKNKNKNKKQYSILLGHTHIVV